VSPVVNRDRKAAGAALRILVILSFGIRQNGSGRRRANRELRHLITDLSGAYASLGLQCLDPPALQGPPPSESPARADWL